MSQFLVPESLSEIVEESSAHPVIIFKYSNECGTSDMLKDELEKMNGKISAPIFLVTVQKQPALSEKIERLFEVKHESPQIFVLDKGKVIYTAHHGNIDIKKLP